jgi:hypothetical protein
MPEVTAEQWAVAREVGVVAGLAAALVVLCLATVRAAGKVARSDARGWAFARASLALAAAGAGAWFLLPAFGVDPERLARTASRRQHGALEAALLLYGGHVALSALVAPFALTLRMRPLTVLRCAVELPLRIVPSCFAVAGAILAPVAAALAWTSLAGGAAFGVYAFFTPTDLPVASILFGAFFAFVGLLFLSQAFRSWYAPSEGVAAATGGGEGYVPVSSSVAGGSVPPSAGLPPPPSGPGYVPPAYVPPPPMPPPPPPPTGYGISYGPPPGSHNAGNNWR